MKNNVFEALRLARIENKRLKDRLMLRIKPQLTWELAVQAKRHSFKYN